MKPFPSKLVLKNNHIIKQAPKEFSKDIKEIAKDIDQLKHVYERYSAENYTMAAANLFDLKIRFGDFQATVKDAFDRDYRPLSRTIGTHLESVAKIAGCPAHLRSELNDVRKVLAETEVILWGEIHKRLVEGFRRQFDALHQLDRLGARN